MKCEEFRSNVDGLARGALLDARTRDAAAAHEEACGACAARLADERALTAGLRALAASMSDASAPARAEAELLSAFRSRAASTSGAPAAGVAAASTATSTSAATSNVVSLSERAGDKQLSWVKTVAVAAMAAAAAVALFMLVPPSPSGPVPQRQTAGNKSQGVPTQTQSDATRHAAQNTTAQSNNEHGVTSPEGPASPAPKDEDERSRTFTPRRNVVRGMNASLGSTHGTSSNRGTLAEAAGSGEITTDFIPLVRDAGFAQTEGLHLVRVELPRSALSSFGIPVNAEQSGGRVKADVLLGEDGTARAIRFVR